MTTQMTTTTTTETKLLTQGEAMAMAKAAAEQALAQAKAPQQSPQAQMEAAIENRIKRNLTSRVMRDLDSDASVRTGMRTTMNNSLQACGVFQALGMPAEAGEMQLQGEMARYALRKGLRAEGATGTVRAGLSYVPLVGDLFLGGASMQAKALYAQQNAAHSAAETAQRVNEILGPVAGRVGAYMESGAKAHEAAAAAATEQALQIRAHNVKNRVLVEGMVRDAEGKVLDAKRELDVAENAVAAAASELHKGRAAKLAKADIALLEGTLSAAEKTAMEAKRAHVVAAIELGDANKMLLCYG